MNLSSQVLRRYASGLALAVLATLLRHALEPLLQGRAPFMLGFGLATLAAWRWGAGPAALASAVFWAVGSLLWLAPFDGEDLLTFAMAGLVVTLVITLTARLRNSVLATSEAGKRQRVVLDAAGFGTWTCRLGDRRWDLDERAQALYGVPPTLTHDAEGLAGVLHPDDLAPMWERMRKACDPAGDGRYECEYRVLRRGGEVRWLAAWGQVEFQGPGRRAVRMVGATRDVTERKRAEEAVGKSERFARKILASSLAGLYIYDLSRRELVYVSPEYTRITGYTLDEVNALKGDAFFQLFHPDDRAKVLAHVAGAARAADEEVREVEYRFRTASGRWIWCLSRETVFARDAEGAVRQYLGSFIDLTERKEAEDALRESETKFRTVFEQAAIGMGRVRFEDARWIDVNEAFCRMLGYTSEEMLLVPWPQITHPDDLDLDLVPFRRMAAGELDSYTVEKRFIHKQGRHVWARLTLSLVRDVHGAPGYEFAVIEDVTSRKHAEVALEAERARLQAVLDSLPVAVWIADEEGTVVQSNRAAALLWGRPEKRFGIDEYGEYQAWWAESGEPLRGEDWALARAVRDGQVSTGEVIDINRFDGRRATILHNASPVFDGEGRTIGGVAVAQDISELRRTEQALKESHHRKDEFLAMLGHELRNPLAPIRNAAQILKKAGPADPILVRARDMIDRQVSHMARLIDDLLDVSRISRGKFQLKRDTLDLTLVVTTCAQDHQPVIEAGGLELELKLPDHPLWVFGDPARIQQIIGNLLNNAVKFTDTGGIVGLSLRGDGDRAVIEVHDTGIGIDPAMLGRIFEPFDQSAQSIDRSRGGLGLGLPLVKGLTELHGGTVRVESAGVGRGSRFEIRLPLEQLTTEAAQPARSRAESQRSNRVLVIEDNLDAAASLEMLLSLLGHQTRVAYTGPEGMRKAREFRPDVVLCDIGLPGEMDGYDVARALRADRQLSSAYLIAMTGYGQEEDRRLAHEAGFDHHLTKPADPDALECLLAR